MKIKNTFVIAMLFAIVACSACGGMGTGGGTSVYPVRYTDASGAVIAPQATDVPVDTLFTATLSVPLDGITFDGNFFIVAGTKDLPHDSGWDGDICNKGNAIPSELTNCDAELLYSCTLTPTDPLAGNTAYSLCISTDAKYPYNGRSYEGSTLSFTTAASI